MAIARPPVALGACSVSIIDLATAISYRQPKTKRTRIIVNGSLWLRSDQKELETGRSLFAHPI